MTSQLYFRSPPAQCAVQCSSSSQLGSGVVCTPGCTPGTWRGTWDPLIDLLDSLLYNIHLVFHTLRRLPHRKCRKLLLVEKFTFKKMSTQTSFQSREWTGKMSQNLQSQKCVVSHYHSQYNVHLLLIRPNTHTHTQTTLDTTVAATPAEADTQYKDSRSSPRLLLVWIIFRFGFHFFIYSRLWLYHKRLFSFSASVF